MIANTSHVLLPVLLTLHENFYMSTHHLSVYYSFISAYIPPDSMYLRKYFHFLIARSHCIEFIAMVKNGQHPVAKGISSNCVELWVPVVLQLSSSSPGRAYLWLVVTSVQIALQQFGQIVMIVIRPAECLKCWKQYGQVEAEEIFHVKYSMQKIMVPQ